MKAHGATQNFSRGGPNFLIPKDDQHPGFPGAHPDISKEKAGNLVLTTGLKT